MSPLYYRNVLTCAELKSNILKLKLSLKAIGSGFKKDTINSTILKECMQAHRQGGLQI